MWFDQERLFSQNMCHCPDHIVTSEPFGRSLLTHRAKASMEILCDIITSCNPHFLFSVEPTAVREEGVRTRGQSGVCVCVCARAGSSF